MKRIFLLLALLTLTGGTALAVDGSSGCGPAWYILKDNSLLSSSLRNITDGFLWPISTFGMTFGTSNCAKHSIVMRDKEGLHFATTNYHNLMIEIAEGRGEYTAAFADTMGCPWFVQDHFNRALQQHYSDIYASDDVRPERMFDAVVDTLQTDPTLASTCRPMAM